MVDKKKNLTLDLDDLYTDGYYYTDFDIEGSGHSITIKAEDKEDFLIAFSKEWAKRAEKKLFEVEDE